MGSELESLVLANEQEINTSDDLRLLELLFRAKGNEDAADKVAIERASAISRDDVVFNPALSFVSG